MPDTATPSRSTLKVHRIEVRPRRGQADPRGASVLRQIETLGLERRPKRVDYAAVYLVEGDLTSDEVHRIADELLADCVTQAAEIHPTDAAAKARVSPGVAVIEVHPLPGVTDPAAESVQLAIEAMLGQNATRDAALHRTPDHVTLESKRVTRREGYTLLYPVYLGRYRYKNEEIEVFIDGKTGETRTKVPQAMIAKPPVGELVSRKGCGGQAVAMLVVGMVFIGGLVKLLG